MTSQSQNEGVQMNIEEKKGWPQKPAECEECGNKHPDLIYARYKKERNDTEWQRKWICPVCAHCFIVETRVPYQELTAQEKIELAQQLNQNLGYLAAARAFCQIQPLYYDRSKLWWMWRKEGKYWEEVDETEIINTVRTTLGLFADASIKRYNYLMEALRQVGREQAPENLQKEWIQFGGVQINIHTGNRRESTPSYFSTNNIPWSIGLTTDTPTMDKLFAEWVGEKYVKTLYEIIAYTCYRHYPIHRIFTFIGSGRNGKGQFFNVIKKFLGQKNCASTQLKLLSENRFETFNIYRKLIAVMGETDYAIINSTDMLKRLSGGDLIRYEKKNKDAFSDENYTKLLISTNSLPSSGDTSDGWYRRWLIIEFPNEFPEGRDVYTNIPDKEYEALAAKIIKILPELLKRGGFSHEGDIKERARRYIAASNPLIPFIREYCIADPANEDLYAPLGKVFTRYNSWLRKQKKRAVKMQEFKTVLTNEGFYIERTSRGEYNGINLIFGLKLKDKLLEYGQERGHMEGMREMYESQLIYAYKGAKWESIHNAHNLHTGSVTPEFKNGVNEKLKKLSFSTEQVRKILVLLEQKYPDGIPYEVCEELITDWDEFYKRFKENGDIFDVRQGFIKVM